MKVGDKIVLQRRYSPLNGYSIRIDLDGAVATILEIQDRPNGMITVEYGGEKLLVFRDAIADPHIQLGLP